MRRKRPLPSRPCRQKSSPPQQRCLRLGAGRFAGRHGRQTCPRDVRTAASSPVWENIMTRRLTLPDSLAPRPKPPAEGSAAAAAAADLAAYRTPPALRDTSLGVGRRRRQPEVPQGSRHFPLRAGAADLDLQRPGRAGPRRDRGRPGHGRQIAAELRRRGAGAEALSVGACSLSAGATNAAASNAEYKPERISTGRLGPPRALVRRLALHSFFR